MSGSHGECLGNCINGYVTLEYGSRFDEQFWYQHSTQNTIGLLRLLNPDCNKWLPDKDHFGKFWTIRIGLIGAGRIGRGNQHGG